MLCAKRTIMTHFGVSLTHYYNTFKTLILLVHPFRDLRAIVAGSVSSPMSFADLWDLRQALGT